MAEAGLSSNSGCALTSWTAAAQAVKQLLAAAAGSLQRQSGQLVAAMGDILALPDVHAFPEDRQHKQQQAFDQLLMMLPKLLVRVLDVRMHSKGWQHSAFASINSVLQALEHVGISAGIDYAVTEDAMPLLPALAKQWQQTGLLQKLAAVQLEQSQLLKQQALQQQRAGRQDADCSHQQGQYSLDDQLALSGRLLQVWLLVDTGGWWQQCQSNLFSIMCSLPVQQLGPVQLWIQEAAFCMICCSMICCSRCISVGAASTASLLCFSR